MLAVGRAVSFLRAVGRFAGFEWESAESALNCTPARRAARPGAGAIVRMENTMHSEKVRVLMIGAGSMANSVHYPSLDSFDDVEIAGICELDPDRLRSTSDRYRIDERKRFLAQKVDDYQKAVEAVNPDAVYAIGHPNIMYPVWKWCLEQGRNLYIEKPMGITAHEARSLAYLAAKHNCITQVSFQRRSCPMVMRLRDACLERGPITHAICEFYKCNPEPYLEARDHMMDDGVHAIDTLRWMCGGEVVEVQSVTRRVGAPDLNFLSALLRFDNGATGVLLNSWTSGRRIFRVQIHGLGICAEAEHEGKGTLYADGDTVGKVFDTREEAGSSELYAFGGFRSKNREFIDAVKMGTQPGSCFADAVKTMEVADLILAQGLVRGD